MKAEGAQPDLLPDTVHASARGETQQNIKSSHKSPIRPTKSAVIVRWEPGARCERQHTQRQLLAIGAPWLLVLLQVLLSWQHQDSFQTLLEAAESRHELAWCSSTKCKQQCLLKRWAAGDLLRLAV